MKTDHTARETAFLAPPITIGNRVLRPLSAASHHVLRSTGNRLLDGSAASTEEGLLSALAFVFIHAAPIDEVLAAAAPVTRFQAPRLLGMSMADFNAFYFGDQPDVLAELSRGKFEQAVLTFTAGIPMEELQRAIESITASADLAAAGVVDAIPKPGEEPADPN